MRPLSHSVVGIPLPKGVDIGGYMGVQRGAHKGGTKGGYQGGIPRGLPRRVLGVLEAFLSPLVEPKNQ